MLKFPLKLQLKLYIKSLILPFLIPGYTIITVGLPILKTCQMIPFEGKEKNFLINLMINNWIFFFVPLIKI